MNDQFREILENLQATIPRSRLKPYAELIEALRQRNCPYREIARVLAENCGVKVSHSTLHEFVQRHLAKEPVPSTASAPRAANIRMPQGNSGDIATPRDIRQKIEDLRRSSVPLPSESKGFHFDDSEPLRLKPEKA